MFVLVAQLCPTLWDPMDCSPPASSVLGILQARILEWVAIPFNRGSSWSRNGTRISLTAGGVFTICRPNLMPLLTKKEVRLREGSCSRSHSWRSGKGGHWPWAVWPQAQGFLPSGSLLLAKVSGNKWGEGCKQLVGHWYVYRMDPKLLPCAHVLILS